MSTKLTIKQAVEVIPVSESSLRRAIKNGGISSEKDDQGRRRIDTAELIRVYGELSDKSVNSSQMNNVDTSKIIDLLETQVNDLKSQLTAEKEEKTKLIELAARLQKQNEVLMLPKPRRRLSDVINFFKSPQPNE